jgi:hypothetical protein
MLTRFVLSEQFVSLFINFFLNIDLLFLDLNVTPIPFELVAMWEAVLVLAPISVVGAGPIPSILILLHGL